MKWILLKIAPKSISALPYKLLYLTHYLNSFRRKPAITKFDRHITTIHKSSQSIATITGSFLHKSLILFQTVHK